MILLTNDAPQPRPPSVPGPAPSEPGSASSGLGSASSELGPAEAGPGPAGLGQVSHRAHRLLWRWAFPGDRARVSLVRRFVRELLAGTGTEDDATVITSELVGNALLHTDSGRPGGWFGIELTAGETVRIAVTDLGGGEQIPHTEPSDDFSTSGRGLRIVAALSSANGVTGNPHDGHTVWAELHPDPRR